MLTSLIRPAQQSTTITGYVFLVLTYSDANSLQHLIWSGASLFPARNAYDFRVVTPEDPTTLSFIVAPSRYLPGHTSGAAVRLNNSYEIVAELWPPFVTPSFNIHEYKVINNGTSALLLYSEPVLVDGIWAMDDGFAEIDVETKEIRFRWHSLADLQLDASYLHPSDSLIIDENHPWDWL